jgi:hypothetical protein
LARIPTDELEHLKREVPLERLVVGFGIELRRHGASRQRLVNIGDKVEAKDLLVVVEGKG